MSGNIQEPADSTLKADANEDVTDLKKEITEDEEEMSPPEEEENDAVQLNAGTIFGVIFIAIAVVMLVIMLVLSGKKKDKQEENKLDKIGRKHRVEFSQEPKETENPYADAFKPEEPDAGDRDTSEADVDEVLAGLHPDLQLPGNQSPPAGAPPAVAPIGSARTTTSSGGPSRPDTRNSKSPREVEGIKGLEYKNPDGAVNAIAAAMNGGGTRKSTATTQPPSKEEYIAQMLQYQQMQATAQNTGTGAYQTNKENFFNNQGSAAGAGEFLSYNSLWDGTIIPAALITAISTDNPGNITARVTENVYSSYDGALLLIPEGTVVFGSYNSSVAYGQTRIQVAWNLLIRPDGYRLQLGNMNGVDAQGMSGYEGDVSNHPFATLKALGLVAMFSIIQTEVTNEIDAANNEYVQNAMTDIYKESSKLGNRILERALDIKPTITLPIGEEVKLITNMPLTLPPVEINPVTRKYVRTKH